MTPRLSLDIRTRIWMALGFLVLATVVTGVLAWKSLDRADTRLQLLHSQTLAEVTSSISLSRQASDVAALAPYLLSFESRYLIEQEGRDLLAKLASIVENWPDAAAAGQDGIEEELVIVVEGMEVAVGDLIQSAAEAISLVDQRQRIEAQLRHLEVALHQSSIAPGTAAEDREIWLSLLAMARELTGAASAQNLLGTGEHQRRYQALEARLPAMAGYPDHAAARQDLASLVDGPPTLFELRRRELNSHLRAENALFRISAAASEINAIATDFARQSEERLTEDRSRTATAIGFSKAMILLIGLGSLVLSLVSALYVSTYVTGNIKLVADAMTRLAGGDRDARLNRQVTADDEIGRLFSAFRVFRSNAERLDRSNRLLNEKNALFERVFSNITDGIAIADDQGRITACNGHVAQALRLAGPPRIESETVQDLLGRSAFSEAYAGRARELEEAGCHDLASEAGQTVEIRTSALPDGGRVWLFSDATERHQLQRRLRRIEHIEALGKVSGEVAHDFGNVLSNVATNLHLVRTSAEPARRFAALDGAQRSIDLGAALVQRLLAFAKRQPLLPELVELRSLVEGMEDLIHIGLGDGVELAVALSDQPVWVLADPGQLESALLNLCLNASQAMPKGGLIKVVVVSTETGRVMLSVQDNGHGMTRKVMDEAFDPFFTTRSGIGGTGLGLSMVYGFVKQSGGDIHLESAPGVGTTVRITFPSAHPDTLAPHVQPAAARGRAILVEDNAHDRDMASHALTALGFDCIALADFDTASERIVTDDGFDLLLTDFHLSQDRRGSDLIAPFLSRNPGARAVVMSGRFTEMELPGLDGVSCLSKPLDPARLRSAIDRTNPAPLRAAT